MPWGEYLHFSMNNANGISYASLKAFIWKLTSLPPMFIAVRGCKWHFLGTEIWRERRYSRQLTLDSLIGVYGTVCSPSRSLASRCNQKICWRARNINLKYFTFNCCKRQTVDGKMCRWACREGIAHEAGNSWRGWSWSKRCAAWIWRRGRTRGGEGAEWGLEEGGHTQGRWGDRI